MRHAARKIVLADHGRCRAEPFAWGSADCLAFAASCAEESQAAIRSRICAGTTIRKCRRGAN
jgi:hypothetical protein